jgi:molecular chaperone GrpE (heat shock protein)
MCDPFEPKLPKLPFFIGDALLLGLAGLIFFKSETPFGAAQIMAYFGCIALGAFFSFLPFLLEYRGAVKLAETEGLTTVVAQVQQLEKIAAQISGATGQWQDVQSHATQTNSASREIAERMTAEVQAFTEFMRRANDTEKSALRLEVEKMRRAETEWLQILVRMLDHVYGLHQGALRSRQPNVISQISNFQDACRDVARRVGLAPFIAAEMEPFDEQRHQAFDGDAKPPAGALIAETIATGYTFQGKLLRPAIVRLQNGAPTAPELPAGSEPNTGANPGQSQLPLESAQPAAD